MEELNYDDVMNILGNTVEPLESFDSIDPNFVPVEVAPYVEYAQNPEVLLSPDSKKYGQKLDHLREKYESVQQSNEALLSRLQHIKKEISQHQRLKRVLVQRLEECGDKYYGVNLSLPELESSPNKAPTEQEIMAQEKRRERKERERLREKARKAAKREAIKRAKMHSSGNGLAPRDLIDCMDPVAQ